MRPGHQRRKTAPFLLLLSGLVAAAGNESVAADGAETPRDARPPLRRRLSVVAVAVVMAVAIYEPAANLVFAARLLIAIQRVSKGATGEDLDIIQARIVRQDGREQREALSYRPGRSMPARAVVLVPGISELGCYHPRLRALSRHLASSGFLVVTPDIPLLRQFRMSPQAVDQISFWLRQIPTLEGSSSIRITGLSGISFSATLAIIAAARPELRDRVSFVFGIGAYDDPLRCSRGWFAAGPVTMSPGYYPTRYYARWIVMLGALDMVPRPEDREFLENALTHLLMLKPPPPFPSSLSQTAQRWYRLAIMPENEADPELQAAIEDRMSATLYKEISPERAAGEIRCPIFLVHGASDDLIPPDESLHLASRFVSVPVSVVVSPFLTHTHPVQQEPHGMGKVKAVWEIARFFYQFAEVVR